MKKNLNFLFVLLLMTPIFLSCSSDDDDNTSMGKATIIYDDSNITVINGKLSKAITGSITAPTGSELSSITVAAYYYTGMGNEMANIIIAERDDLTEISGSKKGKYTFRFDSDTPGIKEHIYNLAGIKIIAIVKNGEREEKDLLINSNITENLSAATNFEWKREGSNAGTGLALFGLEWYSNTDRVALIKTNGLTKLVKLDASQWSSIKTKGDLKKLVDAGEDINEYTGVSSTTSKSYNDVLAVDVEGKGVYYLIHVTYGNVNYSNSRTTITITGQYKK